VLKQVLVSFGSADTTQRVIDAIQAEGTCWCGGTGWQGRTADEDVDLSVTAMLRVAALEIA